MRQISTEIEIRAPAAQVWAVLTDLPAYAQWNPLIRRAGGALHEGAQLQLFISTPGLASRKVGVEVLRIEPERELRWLGRLWLPRLLDGDHAFVIEPLDASRVRVVQRERFSGVLVPFVAPWLVPKMTVGFEAMNRALKQRVEQTDSSSA
jgi:hypothetical protein